MCKKSKLHPLYFYDRTTCYDCNLYPPFKMGTKYRAVKWSINTSDGIASIGKDAMECLGIYTILLREISKYWGEWHT